MALLYVAVLAIWFSPLRKRSILLFYLLFAVAITASVQLVGVFLVFATLILPALAVRQRERGADLVGYIIAAAGYGVGLVLAALLDLPAGAMIVYTLAVFAFIGGWMLGTTDR